MATRDDEGARRVSPSLANADLSKMDTDELIAAARTVEELRTAALVITGRAAAELHRRGLSWPEIARQTGIAQTTIYQRAQPYLS